MYKMLIEFAFPFLLTGIRLAKNAARFHNWKSTAVCCLFVYTGYKYRWCTRKAQRLFGPLFERLYADKYRAAEGEGSNVMQTV